MTAGVGADRTTRAQLNNVNYLFSPTREDNTELDLAVLLFIGVQGDLTSPLGCTATALGSSALTKALIRDLNERDVDLAVPKVEAAQWMVATACNVAYVAGAPIGNLTALLLGVCTGCESSLKLPENAPKGSVDPDDEPSYLQASVAFFAATTALGIIKMPQCSRSFRFSMATLLFSFATFKTYFAYHRYMEGDVSPSRYFAEQLQEA